MKDWDGQSPPAEKYQKGKPVTVRNSVSVFRMYQKGVCTDVIQATIFCFRDYLTLGNIETSGLNWRRAPSKTPLSYRPTIASPLAQILLSRSFPLFR